MQATTYGRLYNLPKSTETSKIFHFEKCFMTDQKITVRLLMHAKMPRVRC